MKDMSELPPAQRPALVGENGTVQEVRSAPGDQQANLIESAAPAVPAVGGLTDERIKELGEQNLSYMFTSECGEVIDFARAIEREALATRSPDWQEYHSALSQCAELLDNMKDGDQITDVPKFLAAKLATRAPADLSGLTTKFEEIRSLLGEAYNFKSTSPAAQQNINGALDLLDEIAQLSTKAEPTKAEGGEAVALDSFDTIRSAFDEQNVGYEFPSDDLRRGALNQFSWGWHAALKVTAAAPALPGEAAAPEQPSPVPANDVQGEREAEASAAEWKQEVDVFLDIWDDQKNPPDSRCYVEGAFAEQLGKLRSMLTATPSPVSASERVPEGWRDVIQNVRDSIEAGGEAVQASMSRSYVEPYLDAITDDLAELEAATTVPPVPAPSTLDRAEILRIARQINRCVTMWPDVPLNVRLAVAEFNDVFTESAAPSTPPSTSVPLPDVLFDGKAVYDEVIAHAAQPLRTSAHNVADTLDAVVRLLRRAAPAPSVTNEKGEDHA